jgi:hypothetical protein
VERVDRCTRGIDSSGVADGDSADGQGRVTNSVTVEFETTSVWHLPESRIPQSMLFLRWTSLLTQSLGQLGGIGEGSEHGF